MIFSKKGSEFKNFILFKKKKPTAPHQCCGALIICLPNQIIAYGPTSRLYFVCSTLAFIHFVQIAPLLNLK